MSASTAAVVAACVSAVAALSALGCVVLLGRRMRQLRRLLTELEAETVPLVREARVVVDQAATEMVRVGDVLGSAEAVSATVDSASRLAYRAFANPVVKVIAYASGVGGALRRLFGRDPLRHSARPRPAEAASGRRRSGGRRRGRGEEQAGAA
ncbi:MAG: hypothetical protein ACYDA2_08930 [Acidimicrobiales bacterium]